jgi:hypothetical protein
MTVGETITAAKENKCVSHLNAKTTKGNGKVAPQYVGQAMPRAFCERMEIPVLPVPELKQYIQENIVDLMPRLEEYTFATPILYYNQKTDTILFIEQIAPIPWKEVVFSYTRTHSQWKNSCTFKMARDTDTHNIPIMEIQFHSRNRKNMAVRWCFENLLNAFASHFRIIVL